MTSLTRPLLSTTIVVAGAYIVASESVQNWLRYSHNAPIIWFASGVGLAALLLCGVRAVPGVALGAFACALLSDAAPELAVLTTAAAVLQIALGWWLLVHFAQFEPSFRRVRDVLAFVVVGVTVSPLISAGWSLAVSAWQGAASDTDRLVRIAVTSLGEAVGILLLVPAILTLVQHRAEGVRDARRGESWLLRSITLLVSITVFGGLLAPTMSAESLPYALFPLTFWGAFRLGLRETSVLLLISGFIAVVCHSLGVGPFVMTHSTPSSAFSHFASLYLFLVVLSVTSLLAAAVQEEREAAERDVRASERRYRMLIEQMNEGVVVTDVDERMTYVSDRFCEMVGATREELLGTTVAALSASEEPATLQRGARTLAATPEASRAALLRRKDGALRHVWLSPARQFDDAGAYTGSLNVVLDVTERRRAEDRAREHLNQLAHVARVASMGEMASAIAHEINQPLTAIANYASASLRLMTAGNLSQDEALETMRRLAAEAGRAGEVVRKMRGFVRGEEGHVAPIGVDALLTDVSRLCSGEARQFDVELALAAEPGLPAIRADAIQVQQVLLNLVRNAMEAISAAGSTRKRVTLSAARGDGGMVEIRVADSGPGLPADGLEKVFEPFYTTKADGIGIGLALSRSIVDAHGGRLWASSDAGGACFHLTLPVVEDPPRAES